MRILIILAAAVAIAYSQTERPWPKTSGYHVYLPPSWQQNAALAEAQPPASQDPAFWGLPKGTYIPRPGCWGGNFTKSRNHSKFDFEICSKITYLTEGE